MKVLPLEISQLKQLFDLNLEGCPLLPEVNKEYVKGIVSLMKAYAEKLQREGYREKLVKLAKEEVWIEESQIDIQNAIGKILQSVENDDIGLLRKLYRNLKYLIPPRTDLVDPYLVRQNLLHSKVNNTHSLPEGPGTFKDSISKSMYPSLKAGNTFSRGLVDSDLKLHVIEDASSIGFKDQPTSGKEDRGLASEIQIIGPGNTSTSQADMISKIDAPEQKSVSKLPVAAAKAAEKKK